MYNLFSNLFIYSLLIMLKVFFSFVFLLLLTYQPVAFAKSYYCSNNGADTNSGFKPEEAFQSIERLNKLELSAGDSILFRRGHVFIGQLNISKSGNNNKSIYIGAYGKGQKPVLTGAQIITDWIKREKNVFSTQTSYLIKQLYVNNKLQTIARYPDNEYLRIDRNDSVYLYDSELKNIKYPLKDATLRVLTCNWQWEIRRIKKLQNNTLILDSVVWRPFKKGFAYYLENNYKFLSKNGEWYQNRRSKKITFITNNNLKQQKVEGAIFEHGIYIHDNVNYLKIRDISFEKYAVSAISTGENVANISIENNTISQTEVFGIHFSSSAYNCTIKNNRILDIRGKGIDLFEPNKCLITRNEIKRIGLIAGYGFDGANNGTGIAVTNNEFRDENYTNVARRNTISYNNIDSTGYNGIRMDGTENTAAYNVVKNAVLTMNDGGGIYCWALPNNYNYTTKNIFKNNIVIGVHGNTSASAGDYNITACYYIDNFSNNITLENNIAVNCKKGFLINDAACHITLKGNLTYNTRKALVFDTYKKEKNISRGKNHVTQNTFFLKNRGDIALMLKYQHKHTFDMGVIDSNLFISPLYSIINEYFEREEGLEISRCYALEKWQSQHRFDRASNVICPETGKRWWELKDQSQLFINDTEQKKIFSFKKGQMQNIYGNQIVKLELQPFSARVLIKQQ